MSPPMVCVPDDFLTAADGFLQVHEEMSGHVVQLGSVLKSSGGMAGTDSAGTKWSSAYDPAAFDGMDAASALVIGAGQMADLLKATGINHQNANDQSVIGVNPASIAVPSDSVPIFRVPSFPGAYGGTSDAPLWWGPISSYVQGEVWPNGHQDQLRVAAEAWHLAGLGLTSAAMHVAGVKRLIEAQQTPEAPQVIEQCTVFVRQVSAVADQFEVLSSACSAYADSIDTAHSEILAELSELAVATVAVEAVAVIASLATAGIAAAPAQTLVAARLTVAGARIASTIRTFTVAAEASALPAVSAAGALARTVDELTPLLSARAIMFATEASGVIPDIAGIDIAGSRPYLRIGTKDQIRDNARRTADGDFIDPNTGAIIPKDGPFHYGHRPGNEWWRIQEQARREGWTRQELNDYYNNPNLYDIEDPASNMSHRFELPREGQ
ncbi:HNH/ENDO VII family nuclease [Rhodococcus sp. 05-339-2]|nr:HNH/ENDO VII family nuclease [Rhodococcus sp. 05-339-2]